MRVPTIGLLAATFVISACASSGAHPATAVTPAHSTAVHAAASKPVGEVFTADQLSRSAASNVYDALNQLHPEVLTGHGRGAPDVYVDHVLQSTGLDKLRELSPNAIIDVTYLRADQAQAASLTDSQSMGGAILVRLR